LGLIDAARTKASVMLSTSSVVAVFQIKRLAAPPVFQSNDSASVEYLNGPTSCPEFKSIAER
jgi:hypothetical protein